MKKQSLPAGAKVACPGRPSNGSSDFEVEATHWLDDLGLDDRCERDQQLSAAMLLAPTTGATQSPAARAETLFQEAKRLMDDRIFPDACPKRAESQRLDPGTGTLILPVHATRSFASASQAKSVEIAPLEALAPAAVVVAPPLATASASAVPPGATSTETVASPPHNNQRRTLSHRSMRRGRNRRGVIAGGTLFGLKARSDTNSANSICPQKQCSSDEGLAKSDSAGSAAKLANVFVGLGVVGVGVGAVLWMRGSGSKTQSGLKIAPTFTSRQAGLSAEGAF